MTTHSSILAWKNSMDKGAWRATVIVYMSIYKQLININIDAPAHRHIHTDSPAEAVAL